MNIGPELFGYAMCGYFGGRSECRIRRVPVPVLTVDFLSMYPTVNANLGLFELVTANKIRVVDATKEVIGMLAGLVPKEMYRRERWRDLLFFAEVEPQGDILPVRARYDQARQGYGIGINPLWSRQPLWYAGPDLVAATILGEKPPKIRRAYRLVPEGRQPDLRTVSLRGEVDIAFANQDFFRRVIEERKKSLSEDTAYFLKIFANATSYGVFAEMNPEELPVEKTEAVMLHGRSGAREWKSNRPEKPGPFCFPPFAVLTTAGARLMLAMLEHAVVSRGGCYAACDTDSMLIVAAEKERLVACPGGYVENGKGGPAVRALSRDTVREIIEEFEVLHPYDRNAVPATLLEVEDKNYLDGRLVELQCFAISAKRYALFRVNDDEVDLVWGSEHGLGHLLNPLDPESDSKQWTNDVWQYLVAQALGLDVEEPEWIDRMAVSRLQVSTPDILGPLRMDVPYARNIKPANFLIAAHVDYFGHPDGVDPLQFHLVAPFERDATRWSTMDWIDKYSGRPYRVTTRRKPTIITARVRSFRDVVEAYATHTEAKSYGPDGRSCGRRTVGLLGRRPVSVRLVHEIGKEANKLEELEAGHIKLLDEVLEQYDDESAVWQQLRATVGKLSRSDAAGALGVTKRQVRNLLHGSGVPSASSLHRLLKALSGSGDE